MSSCGCIKAGTQRTVESTGSMKPVTSRVYDGLLLQGPVRDAVKRHGAGVADISEADLRPVVIKDFQVCLHTTVARRERTILNLDYKT